MMGKMQFSWTVFVFGILALAHQSNGDAMKLDTSNFDKVIDNTELVMLNFYADWCRFSQMLAPIWDDLANKVREAFPDESKVVVGKVDCEKESTIATRFHISKYPTLKLLRNGQVVKKEYRGQRTADAILVFIKEQLKDPVNKLETEEDIKKAKEDSKRSLIAYFDAADDGNQQLQNYRKLAAQLKDDCNFYLGVGDLVSKLHAPGSAVITFSGSGSDEDDTFLGDMNVYTELLAWATDRCVPLVREITFANAEELTEEGLPFLILFHKPDDKESPKAYRAVIERELTDEKENINFLLADGLQFAHPLHHLGKEAKDLPIIAIDSFRHMYLFKDYSRMNEPGALKTFLADLYSGKLHREYHYGPSYDDVSSTVPPQVGGGNSKQINRDTTPPESTFKKLGPSPNRYTLLEKLEL